MLNTAKKYKKKQTNTQKQIINFWNKKKNNFFKYIPKKILYYNLNLFIFILKMFKCK